MRHRTESGNSYGLPAMAEMFGDAIAERLAKILHYREMDKQAALERLSEKYCIMPFGGKVRVLAFEQEIDRTVITFYSAADFSLLYGNVVINPGEDDPISLGKWWLKHPLRRQYEGLVFAPGLPRVIEARLLNLWQGWGIPPRKGCWKRLRKHIFKVLANGDKALAKYIIKWIAWTLQNPAQRAEVALVLRGQSGTGKDFWGACCVKSSASTAYTFLPIANRLVISTSICWTAHCCLQTRHFGRETNGREHTETSHNRRYIDD